MINEAPQWRDYRNRWKCVIWAFILGIPIVIISTLILEEVNLIFVTGLPYFLVIGILWTRVGYWRCPRCCQPFHVYLIYGDALSKKCLHCGLRLWASQEEISQGGAKGVIER